MSRVTSELIRDKTAVAAPDGMVVARHPLATEAGIAVLERGGNALDAAITAALTVGVTIPNASGVGGGGYLVYYHAATRTAHAVDFAMLSGEAAVPGAYAFDPSGGLDPVLGWRRTTGSAITTGWRSIGVPGALAGFQAALERWGTISLAQALQPAIVAADDGFPMTQMLLNLCVSRFGRILSDPSTRDVLTKDGIPYALGERFRQPALAATLRRVASDGADDFYHGQVACDLAADIQQAGGFLTAADFAAYQALPSAPLTGSYCGVTIYAAPGANGSLTMRNALGTLEGFDLGALPPDSPEALHLWIEACRLAWADHWGYLGDPYQLDLPLAGLTSPEYAASRRALIDPHRALGHYPRGDPWQYDGRRAPGDGLTPSRPFESAGTTTVSVVDRERNMCALTNTNVGWAGVISPRTGIWLNNAMSWFDPDPGHPNSVGPRKRGLNNMAPVVLVKDGRPWACAGATGGRQIVHTMAQVISNLVDRGWDVKTAVTAPKLDCVRPEARLDDRVPAATLAALESMSHRLAPPGRPGAAPNAIVIDWDTGLLHGAESPQNEGVAMGIW